ncbi:MAG: methylenetetrahydrofolate reductase [NAD(P)H] [Deltaproteobacteria bacterium]|nr:methylenetetrahydrofolate reductase [NAD(P)H] [Deltaproteobacteria bacterium]
MRISQILTQAKARNRPVFSFEFFPPKTEEAAHNLSETIKSLRSLHPDFCSVTYGAGGSTRRLTLDVVTKLKDEAGVVPMAHLTCVDATKDDLRGVLTELKDKGIENVLALRGDPPKGSTTFSSTRGGFQYGHELASLVRDEFALCVGGAIYPEGHVENRDLDMNAEHARLKVHAGCEFLITQLFFDPTRYFDFVAKLRSRGVYVPVLAGIMPITDLGQVDRFTKLCGASIPQTLRTQLEYAQGDPIATRELGIAYATHQCVRLLEGGAPGIHFYTLNRSASTRAILSALRASYP